MRGRGVRDARAEESLRHGKALFVRGDAARAEVVVAAGLAVAGSSGSSVEAELAVELARIRTATRWSPAASVRAAGRAVELSGPWEVVRHRAQLELAKARFMAATADPRLEAATAHRGLLAAGEIESALEAASWLVQMNLGASDLPRAASLAGAIASVAETTGRRWHAATARWQLARLAWLAGDTRSRTLAAFRRAAHDPALGPHRFQAVAEYALALADAGLFREARAALPQRSVTLYERSYADLVRAEIGLLDGSLAVTALRGGTFDGFCELCAAWALVRAGGSPAPLAAWLPTHTMTGLADEREGVLLLGRGAHGAAVDALLSAAERHRGYAMRYALRCLVGAGETLAGSGRHAEARAVLREAEGIAIDGEMLSLLPRIRVKLARLTRASRDSAPAPLSRRQRDVLRLVGEGQTTRAIAAELGIAATSVETHLRGARAKLGARTRREAALAVHFAAAPTPPLRPDLLRLAELVAAGATIRGAAERLAISPRTAVRRLAELRAATGEASTVAAVSRAIGSR